MNLKARFVILFTFFVAIVLAISMVVIYFLYYNYRIEDFYDRIHRTALFTYDEYNNLKKTGQNVKPSIGSNQQTVLYNEKVIILDSNYHPIFTEGRGNELQIDIARYKKFGTFNKPFRFRQNEFECIGIYVADQKLYVFASAFDKYGLRKLNNLKIILAGVFLGGLLLTSVFSFFFVRQILRPLKRLGEQMKITTEQNMTERVFEGKNNDELAEIAKNFNAMLGRLDKAFEIQKSFVHHASHELRTPLATMLSQTELALSKKDADAATYKKTLESLHEDQQQMIELTNSLLLLSQYEKIVFSLDWEIKRIDELLFEEVERMKKYYADAIISVQYAQIPEEEYLLKRCSEALIKSAFSNLIRNAYQYSEDKIIKINIDATSTQMHICFENKGKHLSADEQERLFVPFFRGNNAVNKKGFGVGLSIVERIAQVHNGTIRYSIAPNDDNRFCFSL